MDDWKNIDLCGAASIEKEVYVFEIYGIDEVPHGKIKIKIMKEAKSKKFWGYSNVTYKDSSGNVNGIAGYGYDVTSALQDTLKEFKNSIPSNVPCTEENFEWADSETF
ncbi:MAG: hypothetical protein LUO95_04030 [Methylococcaceae bacterium]|nr:hypothetical protein [Methylococcaceae bacterium]MDD1609782.1 hypothetical protein [Methylococcaceae bacterium]MDD1617386.1 hypothetical protein [Methylococcaceae bacterium]